MSYLNILEIKLLLIISFANIFFHSMSSLFLLFMASFAVQKLVSFIRSHLFILLLFLLPWETWPKKTLVWLMSENVLPVLSSRRFMVSCLRLKSKPFWVYFCVRVCSSFTDLHVAVQLSQHHLLKTLSFSNCVFLPPLSKINWLWVWGFISVLSVCCPGGLCLCAHCCDHCNCGGVRRLGELHLLLCFFP